MLKVDRTQNRRFRTVIGMRLITLTRNLKQDEIEQNRQAVDAPENGEDGIESIPSGEHKNGHECRGKGCRKTTGQGMDRDAAQDISRNSIG